MTEEAQKVLNALEVQGLPSTPAIKKRVGELLAQIGFSETMKAIFSNQSLFTTSAAIPGPAPSPAAVWTTPPAPPPSIPAAPPRSIPQTDTRMDQGAEPQSAPISATEIQLNVEIYNRLPETDRAAVRAKLNTDKALARLTGQKLFGQGQESGSFVCPKCRSSNPGVICSDEMRKLYFICRDCKQRGSLFQFQALRNGRMTASAEDFLTVEAVAYDVDIMR